MGKGGLPIMSAEVQGVLSGCWFDSSITHIIFLYTIRDVKCRLYTAKIDIHFW